MKNKKIVFMGSPDFAIPSLTKLIENFSVVGVITQPDKPAGRGKEKKSPPIKKIAEINGIDTIQPNKMRDEGVFDKLVEWNPDIIVVVAFGQILRQEVLDLPNYGCINVHGSLLPRWRGAAPIQASILNGDIETGITIMKMDAGIDTGPILKQSPMRILENDTSASLSERLASLGADLLISTLIEYLDGKLTPRPQPEIGVTYARTLRKEDGLLDFSKSAVELERQVRAFYPWPGSYLMVGTDRINVIKASVEGNIKLQPGERGKLLGFPVIGTSQGGLILGEVQPAGKKTMSGKVFLNGYRNW